MRAAHRGSSEGVGAERLPGHTKERARIASEATNTFREERTSESRSGQWATDCGMSLLKGV